MFSLFIKKEGREDTLVQAVNDIFIQPAFIPMPDPTEFH